MRRIFLKLLRNRKGAVLTEFAIVAPTLLLFIMAGFDLSWRAYISSVLTGEMHKAGRDYTLQSGAAKGDAYDKRVEERVRPLVQNGVFKFERKNFESFTRAGQQEPFVDQKNFATNQFNGLRDPGECFTDENNNGKWDAVGGRDGVGSADDIVHYEVTLTYPRIIPMFGMAGWSSEQTVKASTVLRNQPYGEQDVRTTPPTVCT